MTAHPGAAIKRQRLDNGLTLVMQEDHSLPLVAINLWYHVGSKNEKPGATGFAHLFEHMLFQGSQNVDTNGHFAHVQRAGGVANGSTWYDRTNYYETLPSDFLELGLWLESDRMGFLLPALTQAKLDTQKSVVINERRQRVDNAPYGLASERLNELLYPEGHPYRWPVIGYTEDIEATTLEQVEQFFQTFYAPDNAVLTLVGDFESEAAVGLVERYFAPIPKGPVPVDQMPAQVPEVTATSQILEDQVALTKATWATSIEGVGSSQWHRACLLSEVLSGGRSAPLYRKLVQERQDAQSAGCYVMPTELCATFALQAMGKEGQSDQELCQAMGDVLSEIVTDGIREEDRSRALNALATSQYEELQSFDDRADAISMGQTFFDDPERVFSEVDQLRSITLSELQETAEEMLALDSAVNLIVNPDADHQAPEIGAVSS